MGLREDVDRLKKNVKSLQCCTSGGAAVASNIYLNDGTIGSNRISTITDTLTFQSGVGNKFVVNNFGNLVEVSPAGFGTTMTGYTINNNALNNNVYTAIRSDKFGKGRIDSTHKLIFSSGWNGAVSSAGVTVMCLGDEPNKGVSIGTSITVGQRFRVRGEGNTSATTLVRFEALAGTARFLQNDAGQIGTGVNVTAAISGTFAQFHQTKTNPYGTGWYGTNHAIASMIIVPLGSTPKGLYVTDSSSTVTGTLTMIHGNNIGIKASTNIGTQGSAKNGGAYSIGIDGLVPGGASVTSSVYVAAVRGNVLTNVHVTGYGGHFTAFQSAGLSYTKDTVGVLGFGVENTIVNLSTGKVIGGQFKTSVSGGGIPLTKHMAINVPLSGNDGVVVLGADLAIRDAMLQVTGDIDIIGAANGIILEDNLGSGNRCKVYVKELTPGVFTLHTIPVP